MTSNQTYLPPKINGLETRLAEQNQVERRQNADRIYNVLINNEDNEKRIKNLPRQSISDPLWDQFFNGGAAISSKCNEGLSMQGDTKSVPYINTKREYRYKISLCSCEKSYSSKQLESRKQNCLKAFATTIGKR
ncbi:unnamed protein product [Rhizophagus irregularis]|nr:unnamed protein product [Rhizophagus irregularis]